MKHLLVFTFLSLSLLSACASTPPIVATHTPTIVPVEASSTPEVVAAATFDLQKLEGIWTVDNRVFIRHAADGTYSVALDSIKNFLGQPLDGRMTVEGDVIKLYGGLGCSPTYAGVYRISVSEAGDRYALALVEDPCGYRKGGDIPAANTYVKLEPSVLPGIYETKITQAQAEEAGGGDLLKYAGTWELQLNTDNRFVLLQNGQRISEGEYLSAGEQFTLEHANICRGPAGPVVTALIDEGSVTFSKDPYWTRGYGCKEMLLILTGNPWTRKKS